jgi:hypothetical protein
MPGRTGRRWIARPFDQRVIALIITIHAGADAGAQAAVDGIKAILGAGGLATLSRTLPDASTRTIEAEIANLLAFAPQSDHAWRIVAEFIAPDPFWAGAAVDIDAAPASLPYNFTAANDGNAPALGAVITLRPNGGSLTDPKIAHAGGWVQYTGTVSAGQTLAIDCSAWTATKAGTSVAGKITHDTSAGPHWLPIPAGGASCTITGTETATTITFTMDYSEAWL